MTNGFIWNYNLPSERIATNQEYERLLDSIESVINQQNGKYVYVHKVFFYFLNYELKYYLRCLYNYKNKKYLLT